MQQWRWQLLAAFVSWESAAEATGDIAGSSWKPGAGGSQNEELCLLFAGCRENL